MTTSPWSDKWIANTFYWSVACLLIVLCFKEQTFWQWLTYHFFSFIVCPFPLWERFEYFKDTLLNFSYGFFILLTFTFRSMVHMDIQLLWHHLLKRTPGSPNELLWCFVWFWLCFSKNPLTVDTWIFSGLLFCLIDLIVFPYANITLS